MARLPFHHGVLLGTGGRKGLPSFRGQPELFRAQLKPSSAGQGGEKPPWVCPTHGGPACISWGVRAEAVWVLPPPVSPRVWVGTAVGVRRCQIKAPGTVPGLPLCSAPSSALAPPCPGTCLCVQLPPRVPPGATLQPVWDFNRKKIGIHSERIIKNPTLWHCSLCRGPGQGEVTSPAARAPPPRGRSPSSQRVPGVPRGAAPASSQRWDADVVVAFVLRGLRQGVPYGSGGAFPGAAPTLGDRKGRCLGGAASRPSCQTPPPAGVSLQPPGICCLLPARHRRRAPRGGSPGDRAAAVPVTCGWATAPAPPCHPLGDVPGAGSGGLVRHGRRIVVAIRAAGLGQGRGVWDGHRGSRE